MVDLPRISVIGCGYLGVTHAVALAELGFDVIGVEVHPARLADLRAGIVPVYEPGVQELLTAHIADGRVHFTDSLTEAAETADVHFICVGTPQLEHGLRADVSAVLETGTGLARASRHPALIVGKSTVPVGTARQLQELLAEEGRDHVSIAWNPEFLREGHALEDTLRPDRLVFGVDSAESEATLRTVYAGLLDAGVPVVVTDFETAELSKVAANAYLATRVSFINAVAELCTATGADVVQLADAMGHDRRIGRRYLHAGVGFGGGCLPKDVRALRERAGDFDLGSLPRLMEVVDEINDARHDSTVARALELAGGGLRICVLGASFKPHTDDVRFSPALAVARDLVAAGRTVVVHDPQALRHLAIEEHPSGGSLVPEPDLAAALTGAALVVHLTNWEDYQEVDPAEAKPLVATPVLLDARNCLDRRAWREAGWEVHSMGRP